LLTDKDGKIKESNYIRGDAQEVFSDVVKSTPKENPPGYANLMK